MTTSVGFATHGETLKLLYDVFGVLPRKEARFDDFDEKDKKTLQKQLTQLASEEGNFVENYKKAITAFCQLLAKYLPVQGHVDALGMVLKDLDQAYADMIRVEATHLDKLGSLQYFISIKAMPTLVLALIHHSDCGLPCVSIHCSERLAETTIEPSVGSNGDSYDNVLAETINGLYEAELTHRRAPAHHVRPLNWPRWNGWDGSTTAGYSNRSAICCRLKKRQTITSNKAVRLSRPDSHYPASMKAGAVQLAARANSITHLE